MNYSTGNGELLFMAPMALLIVRGLRQFLDVPHRLARWNKVLGYIWLPGVALFVVAQIFRLHIAALDEAYWLCVLAVVAAVLLRLNNYRPARTLLLALGPYALYSAVALVFEGADGGLLRRHEAPLATAQFFVISWLIAFVFVARSQKKGLEKNRVLREEQKKVQRLVEAQNVELERLVAERTAALTQQTDELRGALSELRAAQTQLVQAEKMASLGELTAGIAHEIQNPLNFVNNFADVSVEMLGELRDEQARPQRDPALEADLLNDINQNLQKIHYHGQRAASIVKGMLEHSRASTGERLPTDVNHLAEEYLRLAYQGLRAKDKSFNAILSTDLAPNLPPVEAVGADLGRVLLNLLSNAFYAVRQRQLTGEAGYLPTVTVSTCQQGEQVEIRVRDNGLGIPEVVRGKIFQPFFTTKPAGEGTGLGLSLSYDIVTKGHGGTLTLESEPGAFTEFLISLPIHKSD